MTLGKYNPDVAERLRGGDFPNLDRYMKAMFALPVFKDTSYPQETVVWGWDAARSK